MIKKILEKVIETIRKYRMLDEGNHILVAISGGPDSVCLTHLLWRLKEKYGISLHLVHFSHGLRSKTAEVKEAKLVKNLAEKLSLPLTIKRFNVLGYARKNRVGIEEAARDLRYSFLIDFARGNKFDKIATGHTLDDQAETVLLNLIRGCGSSGLTGIPPLRKEEVDIIRPLLKVSRSEINEYLKKENLSFSLDETNLRLDYTRNRIRHELLPLLQKYNPQMKLHLAHLAEIIRQEETFWGKRISRVIPSVIRRRDDKIILDLPKFLCYNKNLRNRVLDNLLTGIGCKYFGNFVALTGLIENKEAGKSIDLGRGWQAKKIKNKIYFFHKKSLSV